MKLLLAVSIALVCAFIVSRAVYAGAPDAATAFPNDENGDVLRELEKRGIDFSIPHKADFFAIFRTKEMADIVAKQYLSDSFPNENIVVIETRPAEAGGMELELGVKMLITHENVTNFEARLAERASHQDGYLDGWGVLVKP